MDVTKDLGRRSRMCQGLELVFFHLEIFLKFLLLSIADVKHPADPNSLPQHLYYIQRRVRKGPRSINS